VSDLDWLKRLANAATPGARRVDPMDPYDQIWPMVVLTDGTPIEDTGNVADLRLAAACDPSTILELVERVERAEGTLEVLRDLAKEDD